MTTSVKTSNCQTCGRVWDQPDHIEKQVWEANRLLKLADEYQTYGKLPPKKWYTDLRTYLATYEHDKYPRL